jgi:bacterioferritin (cytochrome b1)
MVKNEFYGFFVNKMLEDLKNEKKHMLFYLTAASTVSGLNREELREMFLEEAASEMKHVTEFQDALLGLGVELLDTVHVKENNDYIVSYNAKELLVFALEMEEQVVENYAKRLLNDIPTLDVADRVWMEIFYEKQIEKSREDVDNYRMILKGI